ncbi:hypothetical protein Anapl_05399 [Anas platyrhynchos]|uniref:Uncharacterized protein n=1 Tax=Anas platyrhynchos TaxID=8839 RepID=R0JGM5_ANAPL|nr:hypothetical protein Anapl_05399 [Anas platyrhynchos]
MSAQEIGASQYGLAGGTPSCPQSHGKREQTQLITRSEITCHCASLWRKISKQGVWLLTPYRPLNRRPPTAKPSKTLEFAKNARAADSLSYSLSYPYKWNSTNDIPGRDPASPSLSADTSPLQGTGDMPPPLTATARNGKLPVAESCKDDHNGTEPGLFWMPGIAGPLPVWAQVLQGCVPPSSPQEEKEKSFSRTESFAMTDLERAFLQQSLLQPGEPDNCS